MPAPDPGTAEKFGGRRQLTPAQLIYIDMPPPGQPAGFLEWRLIYQDELHRGVGIMPRPQEKGRTASALFCGGETWLGTRSPWEISPACRAATGARDIKCHRNRSFLAWDNTWIIKRDDSRSSHRFELVILPLIERCHAKARGDGTSLGARSFVSAPEIRGDREPKMYSQLHRFSCKSSQGGVVFLAVSRTLALRTQWTPMAFMGLHPNLHRCLSPVGKPRSALENPKSRGNTWGPHISKGNPPPRYHALILPMH
jgi:hypothetical protein